MGLFCPGKVNYKPAKLWWKIVVVSAFSLDVLGAHMSRVMRMIAVTVGVRFLMELMQFDPMHRPCY
jgi:hypothetical protein